MSKGLRIFLILISAFFVIIGATSVVNAVFKPNEYRAVRSSNDERPPWEIRKEAKELIHRLRDNPVSMKGKEVTLELILYSQYDPYQFSKVMAERSGSKQRYYQDRVSEWWPNEGNVYDSFFLFVPDSLEAPNLDPGGHAVITFEFSGSLSPDKPSRVKAISRPAQR